MAANYIEIDTNVLQRDTGNIQSSINTARNNLKQMFNDIHNLNAMWKGTANAAFNVQFNNDYQTMEDILKEMQNYIASLEKAKSEYNKCESAVGSIVRAIQI